MISQSQSLFPTAVPTLKWNRTIHCSLLERRMDHAKKITTHGQYCKCIHFRVSAGIPAYLMRVPEILKEGKSSRMSLNRQVSCKSLRSKECPFQNLAGTMKLGKQSSSEVFNSAAFFDVLQKEIRASEVLRSAGSFSAQLPIDDFTSVRMQYLT